MRPSSRTLASDRRLCCNLILKREPKDLDDHRFGQVVFITQHTHYAQQEKTAGRRFKGRASGRQAPEENDRWRAALRRVLSATRSAAFSGLPFGNVEVIRSFVAYPSHFARLRLATGFGGRFAAYGMYTLDALGLTEGSGPRS